MLKVIDVDWLEGFKLELTFSDGFCGEVDLEEIFQKPAFKTVSDFKRFALRNDGSLDWEGIDLPASVLRELAIGSYVDNPLNLINVQEMEQIIKQAAWDSMKEGRVDILQAAIRSYVEFFGHSQVVERAGIKSRTSAYKSLKPETSPNFGTLVQLGHAVIEIAQDQANSAKANRI
ncbi:DUF2442 domain-containing protein [Photobacterium sagamiensis]|uniref:type II toxin-antitoxin system antitoxin DhiA n=1 Tax=Photobacterium sagamiensis TaxID=2910241 RepID=UPI003D0DA8DE